MLLDSKYSRGNLEVIEKNSFNVGTGVAE